ncbi:hypothetical protein Tco_0886232 [Tanacetum coccineum]
MVGGRHHLVEVGGSRSDAGGAATGGGGEATAGGLECDVVWALRFKFVFRCFWGVTTLNLDFATMGVAHNLLDFAATVDLNKALLL